MKEWERNLFFSDINEDIEMLTSSRTVTESDIMLFAGLSGDFNPLHTSAVYAEQTRYGERIAHGLLTLSIAGGLYMQTGLFNHSTVANLGIESWTFVRPVMIGDTIYAQINLKEKHWIPIQNSGIVLWKVRVRNQHGEVVASGLWKKQISGRNVENIHKNDNKLKQKRGGVVDSELNNLIILIDIQPFCFAPCIQYNFLLKW